MTALDLTIRPAGPHDAAALAPLANQAGEGLPMLVWTNLARPGESPWDVAHRRIAIEDTSLSYRNGWVGTLGGRLAGCLFAYAQPSVPEPVPDDVPAVFRPLLELEAEAPDTGYVYILSTVPDLQGRGVGSRLLEFAEARYRGPAGMSLIVADANAPARALYKRHGYRETARRAMVKDGWDNPGREWLLMVKAP